MHNYYFDANGVYLHSLPATAGTFAPDTALRVAPVLRDGFWPVLNAARDGWSELEDHRQRKDQHDCVIEGSGTPYWLVAPYGHDTWQSPPRYMQGPGPLPEGAATSPPEKTQQERDSERRAILLNELTNTDTHSARALRAMILDMHNGIEASGDDLAQLALCEAHALDLRTELEELGRFNFENVETL